MTIQSEIAARIDRMRADIATLDAEARRHLDRYDETGGTIDAARAEYSMGAASALLRAVRDLTQVSMLLEESVGTRRARWPVSRPTTSRTWRTDD